MKVHYLSIYERILEVVRKADEADRPIEKIALTTPEYFQLCDEISHWDLTWYAKAVLARQTIVCGIDVYEEAE